MQKARIGMKQQSVLRAAIGAICAAIVLPAQQSAGRAVISENFDNPAGLSAAGVEIEGATFVEGRSGQAVYFEKENQSVRIPLEGRLDANEGTVEFWINLDWDPSVSGGMQIWARVGSVSLKYDRGIRVSARGGADTGRWPPRTWQPGEWHKVAFSWLGGEIFLYVDDERQGRPVVNAKPMSRKPATLVLGGRVRGVAIDDLTVSKKALVKEYTVWEGWGSPAEWQIALSDEIVTPHVNFGKPTAGRKPRVLFISGTETTRQIVELAQRVDIDWANVTIVADQQLHPAQYPDLKRKLAQKWDVIVIEREGQECWSRLPGWAHETIRRKLAGGTGLMFQRDSDGLWARIAGDDIFSGLTLERLPLEHMSITRGVPIETTLWGEPYWGLKGELATPEHAFVTTARIGGGGRVVAVYHDSPHFLLTNVRARMGAWHEKNFGETDTFRWQDYGYSLFGKAIRWAAGMQPAVSIAELSVEPSVETGASPKAEITIRNVSSRKSKFTIETTIRDVFNSVAGRKTIPIRVKKDQTLSQNLELATTTGAGFHVVDIRLLDAKDRVLDWASGRFQVVTPAAVTAIHTDKSSYGPGETVNVTIGLAGIDKITGPVTVTGSLVDPDGRVIWQGEPRPVTGSGNVSEKMQIPQGPVRFGLWAWARIHGDGKLLAHQRIPVYVWPREEEDYRFFMWGYGSQTEFSRALRNIGVQVGMATFLSIVRSDKGEWIPKPDVPVDEFSAHGLAMTGMRPHLMNLFPNIIRGSHAADTKSGVRVPCLTDPEVLKQCDSVIARQVDSIRKFGIRDFVLGDEMYLDTRPGTDCISPTCQAGFREYLKARYKDLAELNSEWGTGFADWTDVRRMTLSEIKKRKDGRHGPWVDHRIYRAKVLDDFIVYLKAELRKIVPDARIGLSGMGEADAFSGVDWYRLAQTCDYMQCYGQTIELMRSFAPAGSHYTRWTGYNKGDYNEQKWRYDTWYMLFNNCKGAAWYSGTTSYALIRSDLRPRNMGRIAAEEMDIVSSGIGKLLLGSEQQVDPIALHYSTISIVAAAAARGYPWDSRVPTHEIIEDIGLQHDYIATQQIESGDLAGYRVLMLAHSLAVSRTEAKAIEKFVADGGLLIGIGAVGVTDGHGRVVARRMLDGVFGIDTREAQKANTPAALRRTEASEIQWDEAMTPRIAENGIKAAGAEEWGSFGEVPAVLCRRIGKGKAVYLNFPMNDYMNLRVGGVNGEVTANVRGRRKVTQRHRLFMRNLIAMAGITPAGRIEGREGFIASPYIETVTYRNGRSRYVGLLPKYFGGYIIKPEDYSPVRITFPDSGHLYDMREGKYVGQTDVTDTKIVGGVSKLYAILPYKVTGVDLSANGSTAAGSTFTYNVALQIDSGVPDRHVIHIRVLGPDGERRRLFDRNLFTTEGKASGSISLAQNETAGRWTLVARDVVSGLEARKFLAVTDRP